MKTNLLRKQHSPIIACLCENKLLLSLFQNGESRLIKHDFDYNNFSDDCENNLDLPAKSNLVIILADELLLFSQLKLPLNLTDHEITELITVQKSQRRADSGIQTYYDYFSLQELQDGATFGLFEARKDKLDDVVGFFQNQGLTVSLVVPQLLVIVNYVMSSSPDQLENYHLVCNLNRAVFIFQVNNNHLVNINQIHTNQDQPGAAIYTEIEAYLNTIEARRIFIMGLDMAEFENQSQNTKNQSLQFESIGQGQELDFLTINWMREQYDSYQSIAMA